MRADVLVVDDDLDIRLTIGELLRDEGYSVVEVAEAERLLEALEASEPVLVLLDLTMPRFNAVEALGRLREAGWLDRSTFLALSGLENASELARRLGLHGSIGKPFDVDELLRHVERLCRARREQAYDHHPPA